MLLLDRLEDEGDKWIDNASEGSENANPNYNWCQLCLGGRAALCSRWDQGQEPLLQIFFLQHLISAEQKRLSKTVSRALISRYTESFRHSC